MKIKYADEIRRSEALGLPMCKMIIKDVVDPQISDTYVGPEFYVPSHNVSYDSFNIF